MSEPVIFDRTSAPDASDAGFVEELFSIEEQPRRTRERRKRVAGRRHNKLDEAGQLADRPVAERGLRFVFAAFLALVLFGPYMTYGSQGNGLEQMVRQIGYTMVALATVVSVRGWNAPGRLLVIPPALMLAIAWCALSIVWAIDPASSGRRFVLLFITTWSAFIIIRQIGYRNTITMIQGALILLLGANYMAVFLNPWHSIHTVMIDGDASLLGNWYGLMGHKNMAGIVCALTVMFCSFDRGKLPRAIQIAAIAAAVIFMWKSNSKTSLGVCAIALAVASTAVYYRFRYRSLAIGATIVIAVVLFALQNIIFPMLEQALNTPITFTGRTAIWDAVWAFYLDHPVLGAGYGSFWQIGPASPIFRYGKGWVQQVSEAHNGYLDLLAAVGPIGLALIIAGAFIAPLLRILAWRQTRRNSSALLLSLVVFFIGHNFTESSLFDRDTIGQVFLMITIALAMVVNPRVRAAESGNEELFSWANRGDSEASPAAPKPDRMRRRRS